MNPPSCHFHLPGFTTGTHIAPGGQTLPSTYKWFECDGIPVSLTSVHSLRVETAQLNSQGEKQPECNN